MTREEAINIVRNIYQTDAENEALQALIPELNESKDERIRKELYAVINDLVLPDEQRERFNAWLEKQKINTEGDFGRGYDCGYQAGYAVTMNEMKPKVATATLDSEKQKEQEEPQVYKTKDGETITYSETDGYKVIEPKFKAGDEKQKEQKPVECIPDSVKFEEGFKTGRELGFREGVASIKPAEWSEDDERIRKAIVALIEDLQQSDKNFAGVELTDMLVWLKKQKAQKSIEWKPQPESLEALMYAIEGKWEMIKPTSYLSRKLEDLYDGLVNTYNVDETFLAELPKTVYSANDIEELKALKDKIDASIEQKPAKWDEEDNHEDI